MIHTTSLKKDIIRPSIPPTSFGTSYSVTALERLNWPLNLRFALLRIWPSPFLRVRRFLFRAFSSTEVQKSASNFSHGLARDSRLLCIFRHYSNPECNLSTMKIELTFGWNAYKNRFKISSTLDIFHMVPTLHMSPHPRIITYYAHLTARLILFIWT